MPNSESWTFDPLIRFSAALLLLVATAAGAGAQTDRVQEVTSPGGVTAWLIESRVTPSIVMRISFKGGASQDPAEKPGVARFVDWMLNEGGGDIRTRELLQRLTRLGAVMEKSASLDEQTIIFRALNKTRDEAFELLRLMLVAPRYDETAMAEARRYIFAQIEGERTSPGSILSYAWRGLMFGGHPYSGNPRATLESVQAIGEDDLKAYRRKVFTRDNLIISVVGDIDATALGALLDETFGGLPAKGALNPVHRPTAQAGGQTLIDMDLQQSQVLFGYVLDRQLSKHEITVSSILVHILSGDPLTSRLAAEIRIKRGLAYAVSFSLNESLHSIYFAGYLGSDPDRMNEILTIVKDELKKLAEQGPTEQEIDDAKTFLQGSYLLSLDTDPKLAWRLLIQQQFGYPTDAIDTYADRVAAATQDDIRRMAREILKPEALMVVVLGKN